MQTSVIQLTVHTIHIAIEGPQGPDLPSLLVYPVDHWFFLTPSTGLLGGRTFLLVLKKVTFFVLQFFFGFVFIFCVDSPSDNRFAAACN